MFGEKAAKHQQVVAQFGMVVILSEAKNPDRDAERSEA